MKTLITSIFVVLAATSGCNSPATPLPSAVKPIDEQSQSEHRLQNAVVDVSKADQAPKGGQIFYEQDRVVITKGDDGHERMGVDFESGSRPR